MNSLTLQQGPMQRISVYPEQFISRITIEVTTEERQTAIVCLLDQSGRILRMFSWPLKPGTNKTALEGLDALPAGNYHMQVKQTTGKLLSSIALSKTD